MKQVMLMDKLLTKCLKITKKYNIYNKNNKIMGLLTKLTTDGSSLSY
jgi:hypothetical protein